MGILDKDLGKAIASSDAAKLRGQLGVKEANKMIQDLHNSTHHKKGNRHSGYDY